LDPVNDPTSWNIKGQGWLRSRIPPTDLAAGFSYFADIIGAQMHRYAFAAAVAQNLRQAMAEGFSIVAGGHSNGGRMLLDAFVADETLHGGLHLLACAANNDCDQNGLNLAASRGQLDYVQLYVSPVDEILGLGPVLSFGTLGRSGPSNVSPALAKVLRPQITRDFSHCQWVNQNFTDTMNSIAGLVAYP
jgi:hypothetical protein